LAGVSLLILLCAGGQFLCTVVGFSLCVAAPPKNGAKGLAIATLGCLIGEILFTCAGFFTLGLGFIPAVLFGIACYIVFLFFIRAVNLCMRERGLADTAMDLLKFMGVIFVVGIVVNIGLLFMTGASDGANKVTGWISLIVSFILLLAWMGIWVKYVQLIFDTRNAIDAKVG
jgi:predicted exporter